MVLTEAIWNDPGRVSGATCFRDTRVPVEFLFDYLKAGQSAEDFLRDYPGPTLDQVVAVLGACQALIDGQTASQPDK